MPTHGGEARDPGQFLRQDQFSRLAVGQQIAVQLRDTGNQPLKLARRPCGQLGKQVALIAEEHPLAIKQRGDIEPGLAFCRERGLGDSVHRARG